MQIYTYGQQTILTGRVFLGETNLDDNGEENGDLDLWGEGTREALIAEARRELTIYDAGQDSNQHFAWKRARNVLEFLGADDDDTDDCEEEDED